MLELLLINSAKITPKPVPLSMKTTGSLFRPLCHLRTSWGEASLEESREWPPNQRAQKSSPKLCRLIDILALPFHARHAADPQERTQILRAQPHRSVGALVDEIQEQHP